MTPAQNTAEAHMASFSTDKVSKYLSRAGELSKVEVRQRNPSPDRIRFEISSLDDENERIASAMFRDKFNDVVTSNKEYGFEIDGGSSAVVTALFSKKIGKRITIFHESLYTYICEVSQESRFG